VPAMNPEKCRRIGIDIRSANNKICGVTRVSLCLIQALSQIDTQNEYVIYTNYDISSLALGKNFIVSNCRYSKKNPLNEVEIYVKALKDKLHILHSTRSWLPVLVPPKVKTVVNIHDLFFIVDPFYFKRYGFYSFLPRLWLKYSIFSTVSKAHAIVTGSQFSKAQINGIFSKCKDKLCVIYDAAGLDKENLSGVCINPSGRKYFLYVGNGRSYKNLEILLRGFALFTKKHAAADISLYIAGNDAYAQEKELAKNSGIGQKVVFVSNPSDRDIIELYSSAMAFVLPSKFEGFGIPVLEAMSFGIPVITSDADALLEIAGNASLVFRRDSPDELASCFARMAGDGELKRELIAKGYRNIENYSWKISAQQLVGLYYKLTGKEIYDNHVL